MCLFLAHLNGDGRVSINKVCISCKDNWFCCCVAASRDIADGDATASDADEWWRRTGLVGIYLHAAAINQVIAAGDMNHTLRSAACRGRVFHSVAVPFIA